MTLSEIWPSVQGLNREEKRRLADRLVAELSADELGSLVDETRIYPVWTPSDSDRAAVALEKMLSESERPQ